MLRSTIRVSLFAALLLGASAAQAMPLYYGGDFDPNSPSANGLANESNAIISDSRIFDNFTVSGSSWHVTGLFTNNLTQATTFTNAHWEIRSGVSDGNGGALLFSGDAAPTVSLTGRSGFGYDEYHIGVAVSFDLAPGTYWMSVRPDSADFIRSFESNTFGLNAIGTHMADLDYWDSPFFGAAFSNANNSGVFSAFSSGVEGTAGVSTTDNVSVPEPSSLALLGCALFGALRLRKKKAKA